MKRPYLLGITGGIGTGKSVVTRIFRTLKVPVYDADKEARNLVDTNPSIRNEIINLLGDEAFNEGGYNRPWVAGKVFGNDQLLEKLNKIIHPAVANHFKKWVDFNNGQSYAIKEAALLFESGSYRELDEVILVTAPLDIRIERVMARDPHRSRDEIKSIIERQWPENKKLDLADGEVRNGPQDLLLPQVEQIHRRLSDSRKPS